MGESFGHHMPYCIHKKLQDRLEKLQDKLDKLCDKRVKNIKDTESCLKIAFEIGQQRVNLVKGNCPVCGVNQNIEEKSTERRAANFVG